MTDQENKNERLHFALAGEKVTKDYNLIDVLKVQHHVSLINTLGELSDVLFLRSVNVIVMEWNCTRSFEGDLLECLRKLKTEFPKLCIVLVNGGITQTKIAAAFSEGVRDYFSWPYDVSLLVERIQYLGNLGYRKNFNEVKTDN